MPLKINRESGIVGEDKTDNDSYLNLDEVSILECVS